MSFCIWQFINEPVDVWLLRHWPTKMRASDEIWTLFKPRFQQAPGSDGLLAKIVVGVGKCMLIMGLKFQYVHLV